MNSINHHLTTGVPAAQPSATSLQQARDNAEGAQDNSKLRDTFDQFVGESLFTQMIKSMRSTVEKPAYFHGGHAEEVFQSQLDQKLAEEMTKSSAEKFSGPMFELFMAPRP